MLKVGIIRGGVGKLGEQSIETGGAIISHLYSDSLNTLYKPIDILVDSGGAWHMNGLPTDMERIRHSVDIVLNTLHGEYGEDGRLSQELSQWGIPHTSSSPLSQAITYNRAFAKEEFAKLGIQTPKHMLFEAYLEDMDGPEIDYPIRKAKEVFNKMGPPWVVKPLTRGSSMGIHVCKTLPELMRAFAVGMGERVSLIVEEIVEGKHACVSVTDDYRGQKLYPFICIGNFSQDEKREVERLATLVHQGLGLEHYSLSHFVVHPRKGIYAIEVETIPDLRVGSTLASHLEAAGSSQQDFINHLIGRAVRQK